MTEDSTNDKSYGVMLPCGQDDFKSFISGLLGKPQKIEKVLNFRFVIDKEDLVNVFHLVDQRVTQQNNSHLVQFSTVTTYDDNSSVTLKSLDDFISYSEVKPLISQNISLSWTYLVKFNDKDVPEKQNIGLSINTATGMTNRHRTPRHAVLIEENSMTLSVEHTARTWGVDIESLLENHLKQYKKEDDKVERFLSDNSSLISNFIGWSTFLLFVYGLYCFTNDFYDSLQLNYNGIFDNSKALSIDLLNLKTDYFASLFINGTLSRFSILRFFLLVLSGIFSTFFAGEINQRLSKVTPSFLITTKASKSHHDSFATVDKLKIPKHIVLVLFTLGLSLFSSYLFYLFLPFIE